MSEFTTNPDRFIFFGCWNSISENSNLKNTMDALNTHLKKTPEISFVVVGGDNFYPDKSKKKEKKEKDKEDKKKQQKEDESDQSNKDESKKDQSKKDQSKKDKVKDDECTKIINLNQMEYGFRFLPKIPIYMLLGNHDLETNTNGEKKFCIQNDKDVTPTPETENQCTILQSEKQLVDLHKNIRFGTNFYKIVNNTLLLMIDTSMYDTNESESYSPCYAKIMEFRSIEHLRNEQNVWIQTNIKNALDYGVQNIIIMGHHPITGYKVKNDRCILTQLEQPFLNMWKSVLNLIPSRINVNYLCADIHNYQESIIVFNSHLKKPIHQYIVGTGGTELDAKEHINCPERIFSSNSNDIITYTLKTNLNSVHGFLDCNCYGERPTFTFIQNNVLAGKKKQKTRKNLNKLRKKVKSKKFRRI